MSAAEVIARLSRRLEERGAPCSSRALEQLAAYIGLLTKWNETVNLTALSLAPLSDEAIDRLIVEPVLAAGLIKAWKGDWAGRLLVDVGSGGGSPAIPLKVALPGLRLCMVESKARKSAFLREIVRHLDLSDADVLTKRIEDVAEDPAMAGSVQLISLRAVRLNAPIWCTIDALLARDGGVLWFRSALGNLKTPGDFALESVLATRDNRDEVALLRRRH